MELVVEFSSAVPAGDAPQNFAVLRIGAARVLGELDIVAAAEASRAADLAIVFTGLNAVWDSEGLDRPGVELPHRAFGDARQYPGVTNWPQTVKTATGRQRRLLRFCYSPTLITTLPK